MNIRKLSKRCLVFLDTLPKSASLSAEDFQMLWDIHPVERPKIKMVGRLVQIPRWQQAYGVDYKFSGQVSKALPVPELLTPLSDWAKAEIDKRLNGLLLNWYDADLRHFIGPHRDSIEDMVPGAPIVTVSFGQSRLFRFRPWPKVSGDRHWDFLLEDASVVVIPFETNLAFTHEIVRRQADEGKRISVTLRAFKTKEVGKSAHRPFS